MSPMGIAVRAATEEAKRYGVTMTLIATRDDWGKAVVEYVAEGMEDTLYRVQLKHGLATVIGNVSPDGTVAVWG